MALFIHTFLIGSILAYDPTDPIQVYNKCVWDLCGGGSLPGCITSDMPGTDCSSSLYYGCGYPGVAEAGNPCSTNTLITQNVDEKHYRVSKVEAFNNDNDGHGSG